MTLDEKLDLVEAFTRDFALLVRSYMARVEGTEADKTEVLYMLQDNTSCFQPYVWSDEITKMLAEREK